MVIDGITVATGVQETRANTPSKIVMNVLFFIYAYTFWVTKKPSCCARGGWQGNTSRIQAD
jgi:hypothetical protein